MDKKCMGEFPMFPGWLFFEESQNNSFTIYAYASGNRVVTATSTNRESSIAEALNRILEQYPPKGKNQ